MHNHPTTKMINKYLVRAAASEAMDGAAPDLERDAPWREKQHARGTACANLVLNRTHLAMPLDAGLNNRVPCIPYFEAGVLPSTNPSWVQLRRSAILGSARHTYLKVLVERLQCSRYCSVNYCCFRTYIGLG